MFTVPPTQRICCTMTAHVVNQRLLNVHRHSARHRRGDVLRSDARQVERERDLAAIAGQSHVNHSICRHHRIGQKRRHLFGAAKILHAAIHLVGVGAIATRARPRPARAQRRTSSPRAVQRRRVHGQLLGHVGETLEVVVDVHHDARGRRHGRPRRPTIRRRQCLATGYSAPRHRHHSPPPAATAHRRRRSAPQSPPCAWPPACGSRRTKTGRSCASPRAARAHLSSASSSSPHTSHRCRGARAPGGAGRARTRRRARAPSAMCACSTLARENAWPHAHSCAPPTLDRTTRHALGLRARIRVPRYTASTYWRRCLSSRASPSSSDTNAAHVGAGAVVIVIIIVGHHRGRHRLSCDGRRRAPCTDRARQRQASAAHCESALMRSSFARRR
jgi:hypothetical protein